MREFFVYLRSRSKTLLSFFLFAALFCGTFALYRLPLGAVLYPTALCALLGCVMLGLDYGKQRRKHAILQTMLEHAQTLGEEMPVPDGLAEADYQRLVQALRRGRMEKEAEAGDRYREMVDYYTVWAHQIKTPIAAMKLTLQNEDSPLARRMSADLLRIEQYVEMVLTFLRLDSERSDYIFRRHDLDGILRPCLRKFAAQFIDRKLTLDYEPIREEIVTDEKWLSFVIEQILSNALKYTRSGGIRIYMTERKTLCIEDTGIGIAASDLPRVFDKGFTGFNGRTDKSASGIGLYLCKRICDNLGISIRAESEPGKGTRILLGLDQYAIKTE